MSVVQTNLVVRADDMASSHAANVACLASANHGITRSIEVMPPCPWFDEAVAMLRDLNPACDVGVHLTLSSEWNQLRWGPITRAPSLTDSRHRFFPTLWKNSDSPALDGTDWILQEVEDEFRAQIELCLNNIERTTHLSYHMGCCDLSPSLLSLCHDLADEYSLIPNLSKAGYQSLPLDPNLDFASSLTETINPLVSGNWLLIEHPSLDTEEMRSICSRRGVRTARERQGVTDTIKSESLRNLIEAKGIRLLSYSEACEENATL